MVIVNTKHNKVYVGMSDRQGALFIGINRATLSRWRKNRMADGSCKEEYNCYTIYFNVTYIPQM